MYATIASLKRQNKCQQSLLPASQKNGLVFLGFVCFLFINILIASFTLKQVLDTLLESRSSPSVGHGCFFNTVPDTKWVLVKTLVNEIKP